MALPPHLRGPWLLALLVLLTLQVAAVAPHLLVEDLVLDYPFEGGDSQDWIANGLALAGFDVRYSGRPPLLPLLLAGLVRRCALEWFPVLNQMLAAGSLLLLFCVLRPFYGGRTAFAAAAVLLLVDSFHSLTLEVMADLLASTLLFAVLALILAAGRRPGLYAAAGLMGGLSYLAQQTALLLPLPVVALLLFSRRRHWCSPALWVGAGLFAAFPLGWALVKRFLLGSWGDTLVTQWGLLRPHLDAAVSYLWSAASFFGLPLLAAVLAGAGLSLRRIRRPAGRGGELALVMLVHGAAVAAFFVFLYDFEAKRFLLYLFLPAGVFLAETLTAIGAHHQRREGGGRPWLFWGSTALLAASAALPHTVRGADPREVPLWPWPWTVLRVEVEHSPEGAVRPLPATARLLRVEEDAWDATVWARVRRRRPVPPPRPAREAFASDRAALLLHRPETVRRRYRAAGRLGNALGKRVHFLPAAYFGPQWSRLRRRPLGRLFGYRAERVEVPPLEGSWLVFFEAPGPRPETLCPQSPAEVSAEQALGAAREIAGRIEPLRLPLVMTGLETAGCGSSRLYLPFLLPAAEIFVLPRSAVSSLGHVTEDRRVGDARLRRGEIDGRRIVVLSYPRGWEVRKDDPIGGCQGTDLWYLSKSPRGFVPPLMGWCASARPS